MLQPLVIIGAGGFAREVVDVVDAINQHTPTFQLLGFVADSTAQQHLLDDLGLPLLGAVDTLEGMPSDVRFVIGFASTALKERVAERFGERDSPALVHPSATVGRRVILEAGSIICAHSAITTNVHVGRHVHINLSCTIGHDSSIGDFVTMTPMTAISGNVQIGARAFFGTGARVLPGIEIGADAIVGSGAVVTRDVASNDTVVGMPARSRQ